MKTKISGSIFILTVACIFWWLTGYNFPDRSPNIGAGFLCTLCVSWVIHMIWWGNLQDDRKKTEELESKRLENEKHQIEHARRKAEIEQMNSQSAKDRALILELQKS